MRNVKDLFYPQKINWHTINENVRILYVPEPKSENILDSDVVIATSWETAEYVNNYPKQKGIKFYLIQHYETWSGPKDRIDNTWKYPLHKIVIAEWLYKKGLELGISESMMKHIPNGIDHDKYRIINDVSSREKIISMLYSTVSWKGSAEGIEALKIAKSKHDDLKVILFGVSSPPENLPKWIKYVKNPPQDYLVRNIYNKISIYLCSSWTEGWHLPPAEAMACGCAVVSTENTGVVDYITNMESGLLSPIKDPQSLGENLIKLLDDDNLRIKLAENGNNNIRSYTWDNSTDELEGYFRELRIV